MSITSRFYDSGRAARVSACGWTGKSIASEWTGRGVNSIRISPGYTANNNTSVKHDDSVRYKAIMYRIFGGRWGLPENFKGPAVIHCLDTAAYRNGHVMLVDGGWMAR